MKKIVLTTLLLVCCFISFSQKYITRTGKISFFSSTALENIEAFNNEVGAVLDTKSGDIVFQLPIKSFKFEKQLMQEHFNENYLESNKYPKAEYKGRITNLSSVNLANDGVYDVKTSGKLTIHGVTQEVAIPGTVTIKNGAITLSAKFKVKPGDYQIKIPSLVAGKIAELIEVTVNTILKSTK